jgi:hypothetical protein
LGKEEELLLPSFLSCEVVSRRVSGGKQTSRTCLKRERTKTSN